MRYPKLTQAEVDAISAWAEYQGRNWKAALNQAWHSGGGTGHLQRLRNTHGPSWLASYRLPKPKKDTA